MTVWCVFVRRERNDGLYRVITYLVFKMLEELTLAFLASLIFSCIVFYGVRLQGEWVLFWLVYLVTLSCGIGENCVYCQCAPIRLSAVYLVFYANFVVSEAISSSCKFVIVCSARVHCGSLRSQHGRCQCGELFF